MAFIAAESDFPISEKSSLWPREKDSTSKCVSGVLPVNYLHIVDVSVVHENMQLDNKSTEPHRRELQ